MQQYNNIDRILLKVYGRTSSSQFPDFESIEEHTDFYDYVEYICDKNNE